MEKKDFTSLQEISESLLKLSSSQLDWVKAVIQQFDLPYEYFYNETSDWITPELLPLIGDALRLHHAFSRQPLSKDRFEFAFERALNRSGATAQLVQSRTHPGHDITINGTAVSLKTEASRDIKLDKLHISKWMELGRGEWILQSLLNAFLKHIENYDRIFQFRCLKAGPIEYLYELVEIPKTLMLEAKYCELVMMSNSMQSPKPGYGFVRDQSQKLKYELYFDGGSERKLRIQKIDKTLCMVHATWKFSSLSLG